MIFFRKDPVLGVDLESAINNAVFPGLQVSALLLYCNMIINIISFLCVKICILKSLCCSCRVVLITTLSAVLQFA